MNDGRKSGGAVSRLIGCSPQGLPYKESGEREREREGRGEQGGVDGGGGEREEARAMFGMEGWMEEVEG